MAAKHLKNAFRKAKDLNSKSGRDRISCPFYEELDKVLGDRPSFCPGEGNVLDSELDYSKEEPLFNSTMDAIADAAVTLSNTTPAETQGDDGYSDDTTGPDASLSSLSSQSSSPSSSLSSSKQLSTSSSGRSSRKKSRLSSSSMKKTKELAVQKRQMVVDLHKSGHGYKEIHKRLNTPLSTVRAVIQKCKKYRTVENLTGRGRKCILPSRIGWRMMREAKKELQALVASWGHQVSKSTIRHHLYNHRLFGRVARRKPFLTTRHRSKRLEFTKRHLNEHWTKVLWSDETKIVRFGQIQ